MTVGYELYFVALLPLPALIDWLVTTFWNFDGYNITRSLTGSLLGYGYGLGIVLIVARQSITIIILGAIYALLSFTLLIYQFE